MSRDEITFGVKVLGTLLFLTLLFATAYAAGRWPYGSTRRTLLALPAFFCICAVIGVWAPRRKR